MDDIQALLSQASQEPFYRLGSKVAELKLVPRDLEQELRLVPKDLEHKLRKGDDFFAGVKAHAEKQLREYEAAAAALPRGDDFDAEESRAAEARLDATAAAQRAFADDYDTRYSKWVEQQRGQGRVDRTRHDCNARFTCHWKRVVTLIQRKLEFSEGMFRLLFCTFDARSVLERSAICSFAFQSTKLSCQPFRRNRRASARVWRRPTSPSTPSSRSPKATRRSARTRRPSWRGSRSSARCRHSERGCSKTKCEKKEILL